MRKFLSLFFCALLFFTMTACNFGKPKETAAPDLNRLFTCTAEIRYDDFEMSAELKRLGDGMWEVEFSAPKTLAGVKLSYSEEAISASYKGLSFSIPKDAAPVKAIFTMIFQTIDKSAAMPELPFSEEDGVLVFEGKNDYGKFFISTDKETGDFIGFNMPDYELEVKCGDYKIIE